MKHTYSSKKFSNNTQHIIFFHGIGDQNCNYNSAKTLIEELEKAIIDDIDPTQTEKLAKINAQDFQAHNYPDIFQKPNMSAFGHKIKLFFISSTLLTYIVLPCIVLSSILLATRRIAGLTRGFITSTAILLSICVLLSLPFLFISKDLSKSSIEAVDKLIQDGINPENIVLLGHSFGGVAVSEIIKHYGNKNTKLRGAIFTSSFSSLMDIIRIRELKDLPWLLEKFYIFRYLHLKIY